MSTAREAILGRLREARVAHGSGDAAEAVARRIAEHPIGLVPARGRGDAGEAAIARFTGEAERVAAVVRRVPDLAAAPAAIADWLRAHNLPGRLRAAGDPWLASAPWSTAPMLEILHGAVAPEDEVGLTRAQCGIAETGTLMLWSSAATPTGLAFLPETSIVLLPASDIVGSYEDAYARLRANGQDLPRSLNFITGPSRTGDIAQTLLLGAHGPKRLLVLLVGEAAG